MTLDSQKNRPVIKDRAPSNIQGAGRKCLGWFILELLQDMATHGLDAGNCIKQIIDAIKTVWPRLGSKYRREVMGSIVVILCERVRSGPIETREPHTCLDTRPIRAAIEDIDTIYEEIARDITANVINESAAGSVPGTGSVEGNDLKSFKKEQKEKKDASAAHSSVKMDKAYSVLRKMYGMDDED
jgi:hypothetical protein